MLEDAICLANKQMHRHAYEGMNLPPCEQLVALNVCNGKFSITASELKSCRQHCCRVK